LLFLVLFFFEFPGTLLAARGQHGAEEGEEEKERRRRRGGEGEESPSGRWRRRTETDTLAKEGSFAYVA
jgi:hypothetical protein